MKKACIFGGVVTIALVAAFCGTVTIWADESPVPADVPYPTAYRSWTFLHASMVPAKFGAFGKKACEKPCTSGIFYFYANDKAMQGLKTGSYADGSVIAEEMLEFQTDEKGGGKEGERRIVGVMVKNSQKYTSTAGWGFASFEGPDKPNTLDAKAQTACFQCHVGKKDKGYVFAEYKER